MFDVYFFSSLFRSLSLSYNVNICPCTRTFQYQTISVVLLNCDEKLFGANQANIKTNFLCANCLSSHDIFTDMLYAVWCYNRAVLRLKNWCIIDKYTEKFSMHLIFDDWVCECTLSSRSVPNKTLEL